MTFIYSTIIKILVNLKGMTFTTRDLATSISAAAIDTSLFSF